MALIDKYRRHSIRIPVRVHCPRDSDLDAPPDMAMAVPFDAQHPYSVHALIVDIMRCVQRKHRRFPLVPLRITADSFLGRTIEYADYDWTHSDANVADYAQQIVEQLGLTLLIDLAIFEHRVLDFEPVCEQMKSEHGLCPIYAKMRYQDEFSEKMLNHLYECKHLTVDCKFGDRCYAFQRLVDGGNMLKDRCHIQIYRHPPRNRAPRRARGRGQEMKGLEDGINAFSLNDEFAENMPLHYVTTTERQEIGYDPADGFLAMLVAEVVANGFECTARSL